MTSTNGFWNSKHTGGQGRFAGSHLILLLFLVFLPFQATSLRAQEETQDLPVQPNENRLFIRFAHFRTDLDITDFFERAKEFADAGRYETAVRFLQNIFDVNPENDAFVQHGPRVLRPSRLIAQDLLLQWPTEALDNYRVIADPPAGALFQKSHENFEVASLAEIVRRYFLSSYGDEAAYRLACYRLDRGEFAAAHRLLTQIRERYPDPSVPGTDILLRLAVAAAKLGNSEQAQQLWGEYQTAAPDTEPSWTKDVRQLVLAATGDGGLPEAGSSPVQIASLPHEPRERGASMTSRWQAAGIPADYLTTRFRRFLDLLGFAWGHHSRRPADKFLADGEHVWVSSAFGVGCFTVDGREIWSASGAKPAKYLSSDAARQAGLRTRGLNDEHLSVWSAFSDHVEGQISLAYNNLYRIEGSWFTFPRRIRVKRKGGGGNRYVSIRDGSRLAAYDSGTGRRLWHVGGGDEDMEGILTGVRFLNAPVPVGGNILVCFEKKDAMHLAALDPEDGTIEWTVYLCSYEQALGPPEGPVDIEVDGPMLFIATGKGALFSVDGLTGAIEWATTYDRVHDKLAATGLGMDPLPPRPVTWEENTVYPAGQHLLLMPYDAPNVLSFDRMSGELIYKIEAENALYPLGISDRTLIIAGEDFIQAHQLETGETIWREDIPPTTGRGLLTDRGILLPIQDEVRVMSPENGQITDRFAVAHAEQTPVGNLHAHDGRLYATGLGNVARIDPVNKLRDDLTRQVVAEESTAVYLERGRFHMRLGEYRQAVADLRKAYAIAADDPRQVKYRELRDQLRRLEEEAREVIGQFTWFADDFDRTALGPDYEATQGDAKIQDGALHMTGNEVGAMTVQIKKRIPGNFRVRVTGWQPEDVEKPSDLSFKLDIHSGAGNIKDLYAMFGTNWNVRSKLLINNNDLGETTKYLIEPGKRHQLDLVRIGSRIKLSVDGNTLIDQRHRDIPPSSDSITFLSLYGFGEDHYYDNLTITRLDSTGATLRDAGGAGTDADELERKLARIEQRRRQTTAQMNELRGAGYARLETARNDLFEAILKRAAKGGEDAPELLAEAEGMARDAGEKQSIMVATMDAAARRAEFENAVRTGYQILAQSDGALLTPDPGIPGWRVAPALWLNQKIDELLTEGGEDARRAFQTVAAARLAELRNEPSPSVYRLYRLMLASPAVPATIRAGIAAADEATRQGRPAQAELILLRMTDAAGDSIRVAGIAALAEFYEKQEWPRLARRTWQKLAEHPADTPVVTRDDNTRPAGELANAAVARLAATGKHPRGHEEGSLPPPPYKMLWKAALAGRPVRAYHKDLIRSDFTDEHFFLYDHRANTLACHAASDNQERWKQTLADHGYLDLYGHTAYEMARANMPRPVSLLSGKNVWDPAGPAADAEIDLTQSRIQKGGGIFLAHGTNYEGFGQIAGIDAATGQVLWQRHMLARSNQVKLNNVLIMNMTRRRTFVDSPQGPPRRTYQFEAEVFDTKTGELLTDSWRFPTNSGGFALTQQGVLEARPGSVVFRKPDDDGVAWEHVIEPDQRTQLIEIKDSSLIGVTSKNTFSLFDPAKMQILWTASIQNSADGPD